MTAATVLQLSDTHFLEPGALPEGSGAYDTAEAFEAVLDRIGQGGGVDLAVVTGDVADHGRPAQYRLAADRFSRLPAPVNVCPGNHDTDVAFTTCLGRPGVSTSRVIELGPWAMVFVDTCAGLFEVDDHGRAVDADYDVRLHSDGTLGGGEAAWVRDVVATTDAEHVFLWLHHPPVRLPIYDNETYVAAWAELLSDLPSVRGMGAGHTHVPTEHELDGVPIFVAPSFKNNFDLDAGVFLPPGYRTYTFDDDGTVTSEVRLVDADDRWPRRPLPRAVRALFAGELTFAELDEIIRRKAATATGGS
ncbi:MAG: metallophosphoesterase [Actinomycetota bacterium]